ncbi:MAG TPA: hypothetical protein VGF16_05660 [Bryobacteraceae bacterium]|jgi:hypothetical protein
MVLSIYWALALGLVVFAVMKAPKVPRLVWASEELAHRMAAARRRRETRYPADRAATAWELGDSKTPSTCRVVNASRSGLRIASNRAFRKASQVCVQWGDEFFVGYVQHISNQGQEYIAGLHLLSGNHTWHPVSRLCFWRRGSRARGADL